MDRIGHVLDWDQYFMAMAHLAAFRSKDPNTKVDRKSVV